MINKIFIFTSASKKIGYGHYSRSLILKKKFNKLGYKTKIIFLNKNFKKGITQLKLISKRKYFIIFDFSNKFFFKKNNFLKFVKKNIAQIKNNLLIIDSFAKDSLIKFFKIKKLNHILPYFHKDKKNLNYKYFVFPESLKKIKKKKITKVKNVLITFGGSDLMNSSYNFAKILAKNFNNINLKLILGPYFNKQNVSKIKKLKRNFKNIKINKFQKNLVNLINESDLIITSTGLTKYETCLTNKHIVVYADNKNNYMLNDSFKKRHIAINLSYKDNQNSIKLKLKDLINFPYKYNFLIKNRLKLFDYNSPNRIIKLLYRNA